MDKNLHISEKIAKFAEINNHSKMETTHRYNPQDKMVTLISDNYAILQVMSRFGLCVGFGDKTIEEVCTASKVDCRTFLTVVNFVVEGYTIVDSNSYVSIPALLQYLKQSHYYFLEYCFPAIRRKLLDGIHLQTSDVSFLILKFFDEYYNEVRTHMEYEEKTVFVYVNQLLNGEIPNDFHISTYSTHHEQVGAKLKELKNIILKYCPESADINLLNAALFDIYRTEQELESHCLVEDCIFVPAIIKLEREVKKE